MGARSSAGPLQAQLGENLRSRFLRTPIRACESLALWEAAPRSRFSYRLSVPIAVLIASPYHVAISARAVDSAASEGDRPVGAEARPALELRECAVGARWTLSDVLNETAGNKRGPSVPAAAAADITASLVTR